MCYTNFLYTMEVVVAQLKPCHPACSVEVTLTLIGGKWKGVVLYHLISGKKRFNELQKLIPSVSQRMLTRQLRELEHRRLITRTVYPVVPPKVEYALTEYGASLKDILLLLRDWGRGIGKKIIDDSASASE